MARSTVLLLLAPVAGCACAGSPSWPCPSRIATLEAHAPGEPSAAPVLVPEPRVVAGGAKQQVSEPLVRALVEANNRRAAAQMKALADSIQIYGMANHGKLPSSLEDLTQTTDRSPEPIVVAIPKDPWDQPFEYRVMSRAEFSLHSIGADGIPDSEDDLVWPPKER